MLVHEKIDEQTKLSLEPHNAERRGVELDFLFEPRMRRVVACQDIDGAVGDPGEERIDVASAPAEADSS